MGALRTITQQLHGDPGGAVKMLTQPDGGIVGGYIGGSRCPQHETVPRRDELGHITSSQVIATLRRGTPTPRDQTTQLTIAPTVCRKHDERYAAVEPELGADDESRGSTFERRMSTHDAGDRTFIGDGERLVTERIGLCGEFFRLRRGPQEAETAQAVQLGITGWIREFRDLSWHTVYLYSIYKPT